MAADRGTREDDNSSKESKDITDVSQPPPKGTCKKNGMTQACRCNGKPCRSMDVKRCKTPKDSRVNGVSTKIPASLSLSIPTLRSRSLTNNNRTRAEKSSVLLESPPKKRRSTRKDKPGLGERKSPGSDHDNHVEDCPTASALCNQHTDVCSSVQSTLLGPISPDTSRSCTPPLSNSSHSNQPYSISSNSSGTNTPTDRIIDIKTEPLTHVQNEDSGPLISNGNNFSIDSNISTATSVSQVKCDWNVTTTKNWSSTVAPSGRMPAKGRTALCTASTSASGSYARASSTSASSSSSSSSSSTTRSSQGASSSGERNGSAATCNWTDCGLSLPAGDLMDHIRTRHVDPQIQKNTTSDSDSDTKYVCLWNSCKVFNRPSSSQSWLERHIVAHAGDKPYQCIFHGCGQRFTTQGGRERHVNSHFNVCQPVKSCASKPREDTPSKMLKRKKLLRRRKSWLVKTEDFFDSRIMETLRHQLVVFSEKTKLDASPGALPNVTFHSSVIARQIECSGKVKVLLRWTPKDILPDSWVLESQVEEYRQQIVPLTSLPRETAHKLHPSIYSRHRYRKHRRK